MPKWLNIIFITVSLIVFTLLIKIFYFDTNMGFNMEIVELNYSALPMFIDVLIIVIVVPLFVYGILNSIYEKFNLTKS